ncbi:hypothetical protein EGH24_04335 [Halonotius terrestris]|uniref:Proteasome lid subunit RPN8/RPN11, contains Jab1/MPN metalloenzyme (JAMM) motif n=1 Tax=Halonotius terrestris TaxID=2487750 RepID=A0A8J8TC06_9EURY|nr:hypothetical protein [Halonotius terrestris]TQQ82682.1 hypothetical protein EGH24_04335 [Halonotius terrestris]
MAVFVTQGLLDVLIEFAADREPGEANVPLAATPAGDLAGDDDRLPDIDDDTPVITHFYLPEAGGSVSSVFGVDLGTPSGSAQARFISHPTGPLGVSKEDDLAGVVLVATPPWDADTVAAFDRSGATVELVTLDAEPPVERIE